MGMMRDTIRYGIIGCAGVGTSIHAPAVKTAEGAELVACCDMVEDAAREFADEHDTEAWHTDVTEMVEDSEVDAVSVCTPSGTHTELAIEVMEAGADVLCEKPLDVFADRIDSMIKASDEADALLAGVFQHRLDPAARFARETITEGVLGRPMLGDTTVKWFRSQDYYDASGWRGTRKMDGGVLMNQAIHSIDLLQWMMGDVAVVHAMIDTTERDMECENVATINLEFKNGAHGTIEATTAVKGGASRIELNGTEGSISLSENSLSSYVIGVEDRKESHYSAATDDRTETIDIDGYESEAGIGHEGVIQDFVDALQEEREPMVPAREARKAVDIILAAYESAETGKEVQLEDNRGK